MTFRVGQKVVCVDDKPPSFGGWIKQWLTKGRVYHIQAFSECGAVHLLEVHRISGTPFSRERFRPIVDRKTEITVFTEILRRATKPAPALTQSLHHRN